jgi:copper chaperone NosL
VNKRLSAISRMVAAFCAIALVGVLFLPIWRIELNAPQYPEGLVLKIYAGKLGGNVDVVNGLNHYIGMRTLHEKDFVEFTVLPYIIGTLIFFGLLAVLINRRWFRFTWAGFYLLFAATAMIDFYRWEFNYGHNLDPAAPIRVPGMSYQPPLIGFKQLLNFGAYSIPDMGGWIFIGVALFLVIIVFAEIRKIRKSFISLPHKLPAVAVVILLFFNSCSTAPQQIHFGSDACYICKMTMTDKRFGGEVVTKKGKIYLFDDIHCITSFLQTGAISKKELAEVYFVDFASGGQLLKAGESLLLKSSDIHAPMGGNLAAFHSKDSIEKFRQLLNGVNTTWNEINK